jgi:hypothetical protein
MAYDFATFMCRLSENSGNLKLLEHKEPVHICIEIALPFFIDFLLYAFSICYFFINYLQFVTFFKDLLAVFMLWLCPAFHMKTAT